jgi:hypothetical protein
MFGYGRSKPSSGFVRTPVCCCEKLSRLRDVLERRFLKLIRVKYSLWELPNLKDFPDYLQKLLKRGSRPSLHFPRVFAGVDPQGLPRLNRLGLRDRWSLAAALNSFKRGLPPGSCPVCQRQDEFAEWASLACPSEYPTSDPAFIRFVKRECRRIFTTGWDDTYESFCDSFVPRESSRLVDPRQPKLSSLSLQWWNERCTYEEFRSYLRGHPCPHLVGPVIRFKTVPTAGKRRKLGIPSPDWDLFGPLHKTLYEHLVRRKIALKGPPTGGLIGEVCKYPVQTSVDLVSATDNLNQDVARAILAVAASRSRRVPQQFYAMIDDYLSPTCRDRVVLHGQMMGTYTSFPLLCLQSYIAARWAVRSVPASIVVNGDDCLISSVRPILASDYPRGFKLNDQKTVRSCTVAEINSTQFLRKRNGTWSEVVYLRRGGGCGPSISDKIHIASACKKAGPAWQSALCVSGILGRVLPSAVGLDSWVKDVHMRENWVARRAHKRLVVFDGPEPRFEMRDAVPDAEDRYLFHYDLFTYGRRDADYRRDVKECLVRPRYKWFPSFDPVKPLMKEKDRRYCFSMLADAS